MEDFLADFKTEASDLVSQCQDVLEGAEEYEKRDDLNKFANIIDRVMGGAEIIEGLEPGKNPALKTIGQLARLCKIIGYRSRYVPDPNLYDVIVAFLQDATDIVEDLVANVEAATIESVKAHFHEHLAKRMNFVAAKLPADGPLLPTEKQFSKQDMQNLIDQMLNFADTPDKSAT